MYRLLESLNIPTATGWFMEGLAGLQIIRSRPAPQWYRVISRQTFPLSALLFCPCGLLLVVPSSESTGRLALSRASTFHCSPRHVLIHSGSLALASALTESYIISPTLLVCPIETNPIPATTMSIIHGTATARNSPSSTDSSHTAAAMVTNTASDEGAGASKSRTSGEVRSQR